MKPLIIYHDHCTDGFAAAFCAWLRFGEDAEYVPMSYGFTEDKIPDFKDRNVFMLDFSWPKELTLQLLAEARRVVWLDHHKTAFEMWCETEREKHVSLYPLPNDHVIVLDNSKSGAMLAWEHFNPSVTPPLFIRLVDDRDRWQFKYEDSKAFHAAMSMRKPWTFDQWGTMGTSAIVKEGHTLLKYQQSQIDSLVKYARECFIMCDSLGYGVAGLSVNASIHMSEVGHELANKSGTFGMIWYLGENNQAKVSLRSNGDYDVSIIAKCFGGGGHKNAAGFAVPVETLLKWLK